MTITYRYYKFPNKEQAPSLRDWPDGISVHEVGTIYNNDAEYDNNQILIKKATPKPGWHINISYKSNPLIDLNFVKTYEINVQTPDYLWLGQKS